MTFGGEERWASTAVDTSHDRAASFVQKSIFLTEGALPKARNGSIPRRNKICILALFSDIICLSIYLRPGVVLSALQLHFP